MLFYKKVTAKDGKTAKRYYLTKGDTFQNALNICDNEKKPVDVKYIDKVLFKLSDEKFNIQYEQAYEYDPYISKWTIKIPPETTKKFLPGTHIYEYEITYAGGEVMTAVQERFIVLDEIKGEYHG